MGTPSAAEACSGVMPKASGAVFDGYEQYAARHTYSEATIRFIPMNSGPVARTRARAPRRGRIFDPIERADKPRTASGATAGQGVSLLHDRRRAYSAAIRCGTASASTACAGTGFVPQQTYQEPHRNSS